MANPFARQRRLGGSLQALRLERGLTIKALRQRSEVSESVISRLENPLSEIGKRPDLFTVRQLLDGLEVPRGGAQWLEIEGYAEAAAARGWWATAPYQRMGAGQRDYAIVESGAARIAEYGGQFLPGLVQTPAYAAHRARVADEADVEAVVAGRLERQRQAADVQHLLVLEEQAIYRHPVPNDVMRDQLEHLLKLMDRQTIDIRVLPVRAQIGDGVAPRAPYACVMYPDPDDPAVVIVDEGARQSALLCDANEVEGYAQLHRRLHDAAMSAEDSAALIREEAGNLAT